MPYIDPIKYKQFQRQYREKNKEKLAIYKLNYEQNHKVERSSYGKKYYLINKKAILSKQQKYYQKNRKEILRRVTLYRNKNQDKIKKYRLDNSDSLKIQQKEWRAKNKAAIKKACGGWYLKNKSKKIEDNKIWCKNNKERLRQVGNIYKNNRYGSDIQYKLLVSARGRLWQAIKSNQKAGSAVRDLGCTITELKKYLEGQFKEGMTWENWAHDGWHIDHKIPLAFFDLTDREQFLKAVHYSNLQPLWAKENLQKNKYV